MKQIEFNNNILILKVKKAPLFARILLYTIAFLGVFLPSVGVIFALLNETEIKFGGLIFIFILGLFSFHMLRIALWNTYGKEILNFSKGKIHYTTDYQWFKSKTKEVNSENISFDLKTVGDEKSNKGVLVIISNDEIILETVTQIPISELKILIEELVRFSKHEANNSTTHNPSLSEETIFP